MPFVRVTLRAGRSVDQKRAIAEEIYQAMRETINIPENDKFVVLAETPEENLFIDPSYFDIHRSPDVLLIEITLREGRTVDQKRALYAALARRLGESVQLRAEDVFVVLRENTSPDWSFGGGVAQYAAS